MIEKLLAELIQPNTTKILMLILDGLGGLAMHPDGLSELETARTPNLDELVHRSSIGMTQPLLPGVAVGSGPGHLALFGYDPLKYEIGRGALEVLGVDFELGPDDIAARGNFCLLDNQGLVIDRRAGRLPTEKAMELLDLLRTIQVPGAEFFVQTIKEHRFAFVMRKAGAGVHLTDTDPLRNGIPPAPVTGLDSNSMESAALLNQFLAQAHLVLKGLTPANMVLLRGFEKLPVLPSFSERYLLNAAAVAVNGMYRGVSRLVGMQVLDVLGTSISDEFDTLQRNWQDFDFFYLHVKKTDTYGEMGDFDAKVAVIEEFDSLLPRALELKPDVVVIGGDHSSPALMRSHSWHPVPLLIHSRFARAERANKFGETACAQGHLGIIPATYVMPLALAHAGRLEKYRA